MVWSLLPSSKDRITTWNPYSLLSWCIYTAGRDVDKYIYTHFESLRLRVADGQCPLGIIGGRRMLCYKKWMNSKIDTSGTQRDDDLLRKFVADKNLRIEKQQQEILFWVSLLLQLCVSYDLYIINDINI